MGKEKIILTGDRPTGRLHIGHYVGSLKRRVELQNSGLYDKTFIFIADAQALTDNIENPEKVRQNVIEVALDYMAGGFGPGEALCRSGPDEVHHLYPVSDSRIVRIDFLLYGFGHSVTLAA